MSSTPSSAGKNSFGLVDHERLFAALKQHGLDGDVRFLDLACGPGSYSLAAAPLLGPGGEVISVDLWEQGLENLLGEARRQGLENLRTMVADVGKEIPLSDADVDICLMATALHGFVRMGLDGGVMAEVVRVLKPGGTLAIVEFRKKSGTVGPPETMRISEAELEAYCAARPLRKAETLDLGKDLYGMLFVRE